MNEKPYVDLDWLVTYIGFLIGIGVMVGLVWYSNWRTHYSDGSPAIYYYNIDGDLTRLPESHSRTPYGNVYYDLDVPIED